MRDAGDWEEAAKALRWTSDRVSNGEYFNYKYLWMDEHTDAMFNRMRGNSLLFQTIGSFTHWMYPRGKVFVPWDHFIPINYNQSDLLEKLEWALQNDEDAQRIALEGSRRAQEVFDYQSVLIYLYKLFHAYAELLEE